MEMRDVTVNVQPQQSNASNQNQSTETEQTNQRGGVLCATAILMMFFVGIALFRLLSFIVFTTYDMQCLIIEHASVIDCGQDTFLPLKPKVCILSWMILSFISSILFFVIVLVNTCSKRELLNIQSDKAKTPYKKGSFISLIILTLLTITFYSMRISKAPDRLGIATSVFLIVWPFVMFFVVWCLNYTPRVRWKPVGCCSTCCLPEGCCSTRCSTCCCSKCCLPTGCCATEFLRADCSWATLCNCLAKNILFFFYWIALLMYFLETSVKLLSVMLDVAYDAAPLFERQYEDESLKGFLILLIGFRLAFHTRLAYFFWQKIFHGEKDLFSEPCSKLMDEPPSTNGNHHCSIQINGINCKHINKRAGGKQLKRLIRESEQRKRRRKAFK